MTVSHQRLFGDTDSRHATSLDYEEQYELLASFLDADPAHLVALAIHLFILFRFSPQPGTLS